MSFRTLVPFLALSFGLTWGLAIVVLLFTSQVEAVCGPIGYTNPLYILAVYAPAFAAVYLVWRHYGLKGLVGFFRRLTLWRMPASWWVFLVLGVPALFYVRAAIAGTAWEPSPFSPWHAVFPAMLTTARMGKRRIMEFTNAYAKDWLAGLAEAPSVPLLITHGEHEIGFVRRQSARWHAGAPGSQYVVIPRAGHLANQDNPEAFNRVLTAFLLRLENEAAGSKPPDLTPEPEKMREAQPV